MEYVVLDAVKAVYSGPERALWELLMGEQIHVGGIASSHALADAAGIGSGTSVTDLCCCTGAGLRYLVKFRQAGHCTGVDMTSAVLALGAERNARYGLAEAIRFVEAEATRTGLPDASTDVVWSEDAWCYVPDKAALAREAVRIARPGGTVAFTDWMVGPAGLTGDDANRFLAFMKFPAIYSLQNWSEALRNAGATVTSAIDTGRFASAIAGYIADMEGQHGFDALAILGFDLATQKAVLGEMRHVLVLAERASLIQGMIVAHKP